MDRPDRLRRAVWSVLNQTYDDVEVIVVDGGTDERTAEAVRQLGENSERDVQYIHNDVPQGLPAARNQGIKATDADILAFLDDDDMWSPEKTERQIATLENTGASVVYSGFVSEKPDGSHIHSREPTLEGDIYEQLLIRNVVGPPSTVIVRSKAFESIGRFDESLYHQEDWDFYLRLAREYDFACVSEPLVTRTVHEEMMSQSVKNQKKHREEVLERNDDELRAHGLRETAWATHHRKTALTHCSNSEMIAGRAELRHSMQYELNLHTLLLYGLSLTGATGFSIARKIKRVMGRVGITI